MGYFAKTIPAKGDIEIFEVFETFLERKIAIKNFNEKKKNEKDRMIAIPHKAIHSSIRKLISTRGRYVRPRYSKILGRV